MKHSSSLLILSHDVVGSQMAGPGIRYLHLARVLARHLPVTLAVPGHSSNDLALPGVTLVTYQGDQWASVAPLLAEASVALLPSDLVARFPQLLKRRFATQEEIAAQEQEPAIIIDGYNPILAEWLAVYAQQPSHSPVSHSPLSHSSPSHSQSAQLLREQWQSRLDQARAPILLGDFFICASERQRDWWLGQLEAHGRINPATYQADSTLRHLVDVVPYGLPVDVPVATRPMIKGVWDGIAPTDKVVLWGGGLWPWLDPITAIHAIHKLSAHPEIKLLFPGTRHPNKDVASMPTRLEEARALAQDYGLTDRQVFFGDWVSYPDWPNILLESDVALTLHTDSIETRLAFRSRVLEYIWARLPVVATGGDATSDLVAAYDVGVRVAPNDADGVAAAIVQLINEGEAGRAPAFARACADLNWERAAAPLIDFCRAPHLAPDRTGWLTNLNAGQNEVQETQDKMKTLEAEVDTLRELVHTLRERVHGYEQGRFIQTMSRLSQFKRKLSGGKP